MNTPICFDLDKLPPSANHLFFNKDGGGRGKTSAYARWRKAAAWEAASQCKVKAPIDGPFTFNVSFVRPDNRPRDLDNRIKPLLDLCKAAGFISDDKNTAEIRAKWSTVGPAVRVMILPCLSRG